MASELLDVGRLRLLREVGLRGSIAAAARELGLTSSAVSQQLAVLEREAGTALIDRSPRGVALTGAGHALAERAEEVLDVLALARADLDRIAGWVGGPVAIAAVASAAATFVSAGVSALRTSHPGVAPAVIAAEPASALELLLDGDVDIAVVDEYDRVPLALPDFVVAHELCTDRLRAVLPATRAQRGVRLRELAGCDWVLPPASAACGQAVRSACRAEGFEPTVRWETDDMLLLAAAVAAGHGVSVLPERSIAAGVAGLSVADLIEPTLTRRLYAVARSSALSRPAVAAVIDSFRAAIG